MKLLLRINKPLNFNGNSILCSSINDMIDIVDFCYEDNIYSFSEIKTESIYVNKYFNIPSYHLENTYGDPLLIITIIFNYLITYKIDFRNAIIVIIPQEKYKDLYNWNIPLKLFDRFITLYQYDNSKNIISTWLNYLNHYNELYRPSFVKFHEQSLKF